MIHLRLALLGIFALACDDGGKVRGWTEACTIAVVASDYRSTEVSLLEADGTICVRDVIDSGSRPPGLLTALSGDVVLPSEPHPFGQLYLIDRFPNAVVTTVASTQGTVGQINVAPGFAGNPQDIAFDDNGYLLLARLERNAEDTAGSDLVRIYGLFTEGLAGAPQRPPDVIDLAQYADPGFDPMPTRFARAEGYLWVGLTHLSRDFSAAGTGRVIALHPDTLEHQHTLDLPAFQNCGNIASARPAGGLWVVCSGLFRNSDSGPQLAHSGLAYYASPNAQTAPAWTIVAADLHAPGQEGRPLGFTIAALDDDRAFVVALGDLETKLPDRLLMVTRPTDAGALAIEVIAESGPFELGAVLPLPDQQLILVADANPRTPRVRRFTWPTVAEPARELSAVRASESGLPPRHIARIAPP